MTAMVLHQSYVTQCHSLLTLNSYFAIVLSFIAMFIGNWFHYCAMALYIVAVC